MPNVQMPNGDIVAFPDEMPREQISGMIATKFPDASKQSFLDRVSNDLNKRGDAAKQIIGRAETGNLPFISVPSQMIGKVGAGAVSDVIGEGAKSLYNTAIENSRVIPGAGFRSAVADKVGQGIGTASDYIANSAVGKAAGGIINQYKDFSKANPNISNQIDSVANLASVIPLGQAVPIAADTSGTMLSSVGKATIESADARTAANQSKFVQDLITPKLTPSVRADQFSRSTEKGFLRGRVIQPTAQEQAIVDTVSNLPVSKNKSMLANYNIIADANSQEAQSLIGSLKQNDVAIPFTDVSQALNSSFQDLTKNPFVTGDGEKAALKVYNVMNDAINKNDLTASGLLQARKDFDATIQAQKGGKIFDPNLDSPTSIAIQRARQTINDLVDSKVPDAGVKASLAKQSSLYRAMDNIETKGGYEAPTMIGRTINKVVNAIPAKSAIAKGAVLLGGAGAAAYAPPIAGGVGLAYGAGKVAASPMAQKALGIVLDKTGQLLRGGKPLALKDIMGMPPSEVRQIKMAK